MATQSKRCTACLVTKRLIKFRPSLSYADGHHPFCNRCFGATIYRKYYQRCRECHQRIPRASLDHTLMCKKCHYDPDYQGVDYSSIQERELQSGFRRCKQCLEVKELTKYYVERRCSLGRRQTCKQCIKDNRYDRQ